MPFFFLIRSGWRTFDEEEATGGEAEEETELFQTVARTIRVTFFMNWNPLKEVKLRKFSE